MSARPRAGLRKVRFSLALLAAILCVTFGAGWIATHSPTELDTMALFTPPDRVHLLGTSGLGHDVLSRTLHGGVLSIAVGVTATLLGLLIGVPLGAAAGYFGGWTDRVISRVVELLLPFPVVLLAILINLVLGTGFRSVVLSIGIVLAPFFARMARGSAMSVAALPFIEAAKGMGLPHWRIMVIHVLPHSARPLLIMAMLSVAFAILVEASLSFLGLGLPPPAPSWGGDLQASMSAFELAPWAVLAPGAAITLTVFAFNLLGDGLRDLFDAGERYL
jgi:peptide/nickel transport system permease protein